MTSSGVVQNQTIHEPQREKVTRGRDCPVIFIRMTDEEYARVKAEADRTGVSVPEMARRIILASGI